MILLRKLLRRTEGQDLAEYGMALGVIAAGTIIIAFLINDPVYQLWTRAETIISSAQVP